MRVHRARFRFVQCGSGSSASRRSLPVPWGKRRAVSAALSLFVQSGSGSIRIQTLASRPLRASDQLLTVSRGFVREQSRLDCLELALGERALRPQPRDFLELRVPALKGRRLDHGFSPRARQLTSCANRRGAVTGVGIKGLHMRPFVAFDQHIQLTAVGEVIFWASRHQTQRPDRQQASGLQFTTDF